MIKWMAAAAASTALVNLRALSASPTPKPQGYGLNPDYSKSYKPGDVWPLTLTLDQLQTVAALCDLIIPADEESPSASQLRVPDFIDEWISAPYSDTDYNNFATDRKLLIAGLEWVDRESHVRFGRPFEGLSEMQKQSICDDICFLPTSKPEFESAAKFFARFRDLTAGGFYTTPEGVKDLKYVGNVPLAQFDGPPIEVLRKVGLAE
jgi:hypothetical protein